MGDILNISAARGSAKSFDFASAAFTTDDKLVFKAVNGQAPLLVKMNKNYGGDDSQIAISTGTKATVLLSVTELDLIPSCDYQLFKITELGATLLFSGTFTITGDKTQQVSKPVYTPFQNGYNQRSVAQVDLPGGSDTVALTNDDDYVIFTGYEGSFNMTLPDATTNKGKIFHIQCVIEGPEFHQLIIKEAVYLAGNEEATIISNGVDYDIWTHIQN